MSGKAVDEVAKVIEVSISTTTLRSQLNLEWSSKWNQMQFQKSTEAYRVDLDIMWLLENYGDASPNINVVTNVPNWRRF